MNNIMIYTVTLEEHQHIVAEVLEILWTNKLYLKHVKYEFKQLETEYLELIIRYQTVKMDSTKTKGVTEWPVPTTCKELRGFLGFLNFYRQFIKDCSKIAHPLNVLTFKKNKFKWTDKCQTAFESLETAITTTPALFMPTADDPFHIETDGSGIGIGVVLSQKQDNCWHPIASISKFLSDAEWNYHAANLKMAAVIFALTEWQHYLLGAIHPFKILTDHQNLTYFHKPQDLSHWQGRCLPSR